MHHKPPTNTHCRLLATLAGAALLLCLGGGARATVVPDVRNTNHNLSVTGTASIKAATETQVCVFCHTPHAATTGIVAPLWNRNLSSATYTTYTSSSIEANAAELAAGPGGSSKLCLSCHDGTLAIGNVNVLNGQSSASINMSGAGPGGVIPEGSGAYTGFTRKLGIDLRNDHPISFTYDDTLATADGELRPITGNPAVATRLAGVSPKPQFPLENGQMQCPTCHDPHIRETDAGKGNLKFLRGNRFQQSAPLGGAYDTANDIICLSCHDKAGQAWAYSAHANPLVADETYLADAAAQREFPAGASVWQAACQNCHDTHTVPNSRRLLREGTDSAASPKIGGNPAIEETCYQCHSDAGASVLSPTNNKAPDIKTDFTTLSVTMPITNTAQGVTTEAHDIGTGAGTQRGKDFVESQAVLGQGNLGNRHAECTDCHNPHRVSKTRIFNDNAASPAAAGTHTHTDTAGYTHTNIASGVLRGTFGVEPVYPSNSFYSMPSSFTVKRGDPGANASTLVTESYVTREYQVCLKCHSNYAFDDNNLPGASSNLPMLDSMGGGTASGTNGMTRFTNVAREYQAPASHQGLTGSPGDSGAFSGTPPGQAYTVNFQTNNRRGWHPVMGATGRGSANRVISLANPAYTVISVTNDINGGSSGSPFLPPWNNAIGTQTMYCTDCHGSDTAAGTAIPTGGEDGNPWGPHGSSNNFLLKGQWVALDTAGTGIGTGTNHSDHLCFKCHKYDAYANPAVGGRFATYYSGFSGAGTYGGGGHFENFNMHLEHANRLGTIRCSWCHVAVPHGWKNKKLLVNLNDVGPEAICQTIDIQDGVNCTLGQPMSPGTQVRLGGYPSPSPGTDPYYWNKVGHGYNNPPYYVNAANKIINFKDSGRWTANDCGSVGAPGNALAGMCPPTAAWGVSNEGCSALP
ncbi:MAG: hypothetical protein EPN14_03785 [Gallionella sp.]|nr:MAG: hypothetical protein EPN14_03785 [Gallionella sp.]